MDNFSYKRELPEGRYKLSEVFSDLKGVPELKEYFGEDISKIDDVTIEITMKSTLGGDLEYAYINDGEIHIGTNYFKTGPEHYIYLDIIHELAHIKQHWDGRELFDHSYPYVDMPTEIEAYVACTKTAKRNGMTKEEMSEYLIVPWATKEEMKKLEKNIDL